MSEWEEFDFKEESHDDNKVVIDFLNKLLKNWYWLALSAFLGLAIAFTYLRYSTPIYQVNAKILVSDEKKGAAGVENAVLGDFAGMIGVKSTVDNEVEILKTRNLMEQVVKELHANITYYRKGNIRDIELYDSPFNVSLLSSDSLFISTTFQLKSIDNNKIEISKGDFEEITSYNQIVRVPELGSIKIERNTNIPYVDETYLFEISSLDSRVADYMNRLTVQVTNKLEAGRPARCGPAPGRR